MLAPRFRTFLSSLLIAVVASAASAADESGFRSLFNGRDLTGWQGNPSFWSVRDGALTGQTTASNKLAANTFLVWQGGKLGDFELRASFRLVADNDQKSANSGIQYRSRVIDPATWVVGGYQADMDFAGKYIGMLYEEKGRGILMQPGQTIRVLAAGADGKPTVQSAGPATPAAALAAAYRVGDWNEFTVIAQGNHLRHYLNGTLTADVTDTDAGKAAITGVLALQLHTGPPMTIQFKNVRLKVLP